MDRGLMHAVAGREVETDVDMACVELFPRLQVHLALVPGGTRWTFYCTRG